MGVIIITLLIAAIILFILSFISKNNNKELEEEFENIVSPLMEENYEIKKRITALEKSLNINTSAKSAEKKTQNPKMKELLKKQVITRYTSGDKIEEIIAQSSLSKEEVEKTIDEYLHH